MKSLIFYLVFFSLNIVNVEAFMMHQRSPIAQEWKEENLSPFDELLLSWNAIRPIQGKFLFYIRVKTDEWSPWLLYASWGSNEQSSFLNAAEEVSVKAYQDALEVLNGEKATAFQIKIITEGSAKLTSIHALHVYTNGNEEQELPPLDSCLAPIYLEVPGLSQMTLDHLRHRDLCSPTSTTAVIRYLSEDYAIDPIHFAQNVWDSGFDIFGNWVFNVAHAFTYLNSQYECWIEKLNGFEDIYQCLSQGTPVIVSVRGPLPGSAQSYASGHLIVVIGYDPLNEKVICMDPAFPTDVETHVLYDRSDFVEAWGRRGNIAYIFKK